MPAVRRSFTEEEKVQVWTKGRVTYTLDAADWRYDEGGNLIYWHAYGDANSDVGWEIDHIVAVAQGGTNAISNLRPLHCSLNRSLGGILGSALKR
jgi:hypothetical protein